MPPPAAAIRPNAPARLPSAARDRAGRLVARILDFRRDESGATAIEYVLIAGLIFLVIVSSLRAFATSMDGLYEVIRTALTQTN